MDINKLANKAFASLQKINSNATTLEDNTLSNVTEWIDTGCLALNSIISGSLYGGVPKGRLIIFSGESGCGKTFILNKILGNAQKMGMIPIIFDTEVQLIHQVLRVSDSIVRKLSMYQ